MESFGILRTNPALTTNVKVVLSEDKLYFESFDASSTLGDDAYKKRIIPEDSFYNLELIKYWGKTPKEIAFETKHLGDEDIMYDDYRYQIDNTYMSGGSNVDDTDYSEEFEYLAPLHIYPNKLPSNFIVFRVDGSGLLDLHKDNFREEILDQMKIVKSFDLTSKSKLGKFLENSYNQSNIPTSAIDIDFNLNEFSNWNGIDYQTGEYVSKSVILTEELNREMTFTQGNELLTNGFEENSVIYPYIINLKFLFDDTPATPEMLRKWSVNRYYGFYGNLEKVSNISPYKPPTLKTGLRLNSDKIFTLNGVVVDPFERGYKPDRYYYVEYLSKFYLVHKINNGFKVISDIDLPNDVDTNFNKNTIIFGDNNEITFLNGNPLVLDTNADVIVIEIDGKFHRLIEHNGNWVVHTDYKFTVSNNIFRYFINKTDPDYTTVINLNNVDKDNTPITFNIYQYNFSPVKDFDLNILDTDFSKYEYEFEKEITVTEEPKLFEDDLDFDGSPKPIEAYLYKNNVESIPTNEYLATGELFETISNTYPNKMWRKTPYLLKWGAVGSLSNNDYPYYFNVNSKADSFNKTTDTKGLIPRRESRNLDYFYTLSSTNFNFNFTNSVVYQSLSITHDSFEVDKYFNYNYEGDYFDEVFGQSETYKGRTFPIRKYAELNRGDQVIPNKTIFKGIDVSVYETNNILTKIISGSKNIESLNVKGTRVFDDYKFTILMSDLTKDPDEDFKFNNQSGAWKRITKWEKNTQYYTGDVVIFDGSKFMNSGGQYGFSGYGTESATGSITPTAYIYPDGTIEELIIDNITNLVTVITATGANNGVSMMYECTSDTITTDPYLTLENDPNWSVYPTTHRTIIYQQDITYTAWDPLTASYSYLMNKTGANLNYLNFFILYNGDYYKCVKDQTILDNKTPDYVGISVVNGKQVPYWEKINGYVNTIDYTSDDIVTVDGDLYYYNYSTQELSMIHTFKSKPKTPYRIYDIVSFNDNLYIDSIGGSILDNGINIYINKKYKNLLVHIYFNDNLTQTYNIKRDDLYRPELQQLTAYNFIDTINNIVMLNGFSNVVKYYIIEEDNSFMKYDLSNIEDIPYLLQMSTPVELEYYTHSLQKKGVSLNKNIFKIRKDLENNALIDISQIDYYNNSPIAVEFNRPDVFDFESKTSILYRLNSGYNPIFKEIELFNNISGNRYTFNETYDKFGEVSEMIKSKVGDKNLLRITDDTYKSIYPQVDEIGYFVDSHNIFKSTWDVKYYKKTILNR